MSREELFDACFEKWGIESQVLMVIEEMGELSQALARYLNGRKHNAMEELADASLMLEQLVYIMGRAEVSHIQEEKIKRIWERLELEKEE